MQSFFHPRLAPRARLALLCLSGAAGLPGMAVAQAAAPQAATAAPVAVSVTDKGCSPEALSIPAGRATFSIKNDSRRAMEWEILKGVMVVAERENILPGFVQKLSATLEPGEYAMTCGLLSNPRGKLTVLAGAAQAEFRPSPMDLVGPIAEYKVYVIHEVAALVAATETFTDAVRAGRLDEARRLYAGTRGHYERIEPIAELFSDLDTAIDVRAGDFEKKEADPAFGGFHRIEMLLFRGNTTKGATPFADKLLADVRELQTRVAGLAIAPKDMVGGAGDLIEEVASSKISGEEDRYSHTDLADFQANIDGAHKIYTLLQALVRKANAELAGRIEANFAKVAERLAKYRTADGFKTYDHLTPADHTALKGPITALAEDLALLRGTLGVD
ncbi:MAG: iron uptake system protein EfeO [Rhodospirillales bacterium 70-18]|nr:MAG: iron uptake system protein EfeO [Rhodospirillales bacterium 70-18]